MDLGLWISLAVTVASALGWFRAETRNQYAKERELSLIVAGVDQLQDDLDGVGDRLSRLEIILLRQSKDAPNL